MTCPHECYCNVEGERGLITDGTGTPGDPFNPQPDTDRTIPMTVNVYGDLPAVDADEVGLLAWVDAENGLRAQGSTRWEEVAPPWRQHFPGTLAVSGAAGVYVGTADGIPLQPGFWFIKANGVLQGSIERPGTVQILDGISQARDVVSVDIELYDSVNALTYDSTRIIIDNVAFTLDTGGGNYLDFGFDRTFAIPYDLQCIIAIADGDTGLVHIRAKRDFVLNFDWDLITNDIAAIQVQNYDFTN